jgi:hypothetical protein
MKKFILGLFLSSSALLHAQGDMTVQAVDVYTNEVFRPISYDIKTTKRSLGDKLTDTIELEHPFYRFPSRRVLDNPYRLIGEQISLTVPAEPYCNEIYTANWAVAKSEKIAYGEVDLLVLSKEKGLDLSLYAESGKVISKMKMDSDPREGFFVYRGKANYKNLAKGYFWAKNRTEKAYFEVQDYIQPQYYPSFAPVSVSAQEVANTKAYFELIKANHKEKRAIYRRCDSLLYIQYVEKDKLKKSVDSLKNRVGDLEHEVAELKAGKKLPRTYYAPQPPYPPPPAPEPEPEIFTAIDWQPAYPKGANSIADFLERLGSEVSQKFSVDNSGEMVIEVKLTGVNERAACYPVYVLPQHKEIFTYVNDIIEKTPWWGSKLNGKNVYKSFYVRIQIGAK